MLAELKKINLDRHVYEVMRRFAAIHVKEALKKTVKKVKFLYIVVMVDYKLKLTQQILTIKMNMI